MKSVLLLTTKTRAWSSLEGMLLRHLPAYGLRPIFVSAESGQLLEEAAGNGAVTRVLPGLKHVRTLGGMLRGPYLLAVLRRLAVEHDAGLVHSLHGSTTPATLLLSRLTGLPHLCHMQFLYESPRSYRKFWLHRATNVVAVARAVLTSYVAACGERRPTRALVIPYGLDADGFVARSEGRDVRAELAIPAEAIMVLMVGSLDDRKDPQTLLRAVERLAPEVARRIHLVFVGPFRDARYRADTLALAASLRRGGCHFAGVRPNPSAFYRSADVFALPTRGDAFGIVLLEAMAHGKPIVACRVGGVPEGVEHGVNGLLAEPGDAVGFGEALGRLAVDPDLRRSLGGRGRRRVEEEFSVKRAMDAIVGAYAMCAADDR